MSTVPAAPAIAQGMTFVLAGSPLTCTGEVHWGSGAGRGEELAAPVYLTVGEKDSVVRDAGACAVVNSQPLAVVYWGHGGNKVFPPAVTLVVRDCDPYVGQAL